MKSYQTGDVPSPLKDVFYYENDKNVVNKFDGDLWGLEEIIDPADEVSRATCEAIDALAEKCRSSGIFVPGTPGEVIDLASEGLDFRAMSSTAELQRMRDMFQTSIECSGIGD